MLQLHIQDDEGKTTIVPLVRDEITIGRKEGNTIRLTERNVSRQHARLVRVNGSFFLENMQCRFGTRVNGSVVEGRTSVMPGDVIMIGDYRLALHAEAKKGAASRPTKHELPAPQPPSEPSIAVGQAEDGSTSMINLEELEDVLDDDEARDVPRAERGTLVVMSSNVPKREYPLPRSPMVIGRTEDNDIQLDHRSISRHHAKITWNQGSYTVLDMESANGVKVNGDFYKRSDLHPGDELELGHVKLHFGGGGGAAGLAAPADDVLDLPVADVAPSNSGKFIALAIVAVAVVVACLWFFVWSKSPSNRGSDAGKDSRATSGAVEKPSETTSKPSEIAEAEPASARPAEPETRPTEPGTRPTEAVEAKPTEPETKPTEAVEAKPTEPETKPTEAVEAKPTEPETKPTEVKPVQPVAADLGPKAKALMGQATQSFKRDDFDKARDLVEQAQKLDPKVEGASGLLEKIGLEESAAAQLARARKAAKQEQWKTVWAASIQGLKLGTTGSAPALRTLKTRAKKPLAKAAVDRGDQLLASKSYKDAITAYRKALAYDGANGQAKKGKRKAEKALKEASAPKAQPGDKLAAAKQALAEGKAAKRASNLSLAKAKFTDCLKLHAGMAECREQLAVILMAQGSRCAAIKHMRRYVRARPGGSKTPQFKRLIEQFEPTCQ